MWSSVIDGLNVTREIRVGHLCDGDELEVIVPYDIRGWDVDVQLLGGGLGICGIIVSSSRWRYSGEGAPFFVVALRFVRVW